MTKLTLEIATLLFNCATKSSYNSIVSNAEIIVSENMLPQWKDIRTNKNKENCKSRRGGNKIEKKNTKMRKHQIGTSISAFRASTI